MGGRASLPVGSGTATAQVGGVLNVDTTQAGTPATTDEADLWVYNLPANTLNANGRGVRVKVFGTYAANANNKTTRLYFGATTIGTIAVAHSGGGFEWNAVIYRTGASAELANAIGISQGSVSQGSILTTPAADTTAAIVIKLTGQNGTASANDIVFRGAMVEAVN
jgi:hypothetical protein